MAYATSKTYRQPYYGLFIKRAFLWHFITWGSKSTIEKLAEDIRSISPDYQVVTRIIQDNERVSR